MHRILFIFFVGIMLSFFSGCSSTYLKPTNLKNNLEIKNELFEEDSKILYGIRAEELKEYKTASIFFYNLYMTKQKDEYLYRSLQNDLDARNYDLILQKTNKDELKDNLIAKRFRLILLITTKQLDEAKKLAKNIILLSNDVDDYMRLSDIYIRLNQFTKSLNILEEAYKINYDNRVIDKISLLLYTKLEKKKIAINRLEVHREIHGNSVPILLRLGLFYSNQKNLEKLLSTYLILYQLKKDKEIADKIVQIYEYKKEYLKLKDFLEKNHINDKKLLELYVVIKNYKKAMTLAYKLYQKNEDIEYLGKSALYEYEYYKIVKENRLLLDVIAKLKIYLSYNNNALYSNYLGYLLIDHNINLKEGLLYVNNALSEEPDSIYILDSLAWGYYKLGQCKKAKTVMQTIFMDGNTQNKEIIQHNNLIKKCKNNTRRKR